MKMLKKALDSTLCYYAIEDIAKNEEILMPYGKFKKHSNAELLLDYGYVRPSNPDDIGCIKNPYLHRDFTNSEQKKNLLDSVGLWWFVYFSFFLVNFILEKVAHRVHSGAITFSRRDLVDFLWQMPLDEYHNLNCLCHMESSHYPCTRLHVIM